jgi:DNA-binding NarL/FixJ family response regulator
VSLFTSDVGPLAFESNSTNPGSGAVDQIERNLPRVLLADPGGALMGALRPALMQHAGYRLLHARSIPEIYDLIADGLAGDLALVNVRFHADSPGVIRALRDVGWTRVIALTTMRIPVSTMIDAVKAGATGVLRVVDTEHEISWPVALLTLRELQVVRLVADGRSNKVIATRLSISALTVKNHLARIGKKMGAGDRAQIVAIACRSGMIIDPHGAMYAVSSEN